MPTFAYTATNDHFTMRVEDKRATAFGPVSYRIRNDTLFQSGVNLLGPNIIMKRVGAAKKNAAPMLGVWSFVDFTGTLAFVDFDENGKGYFRMPMRSCSGTWTEPSAGRVAIMLNGQLNERDYSIENDTLTVKGSGLDVKYKRRTR
jgi:hypothetical protein